MKNKFLKYPLILAIVGIICAFCLAIVYWITNPIITERNIQKAKEAIEELYPNVEKIEDVSKDYDNLDQYSVSTVYDLTVGGVKKASAYQAVGKGYSGDIVYLIVLSNEEEKIIGISFISNSETSGYGADLIANEEFVAWFKDLPFNKLDKGTDLSTGATKTMNGIKKSVTKVIDFHSTVREDK